MARQEALLRRARRLQPALFAPPTTPVPGFLLAGSGPCAAGACGCTALVPVAAAGAPGADGFPGGAALRAGGFDWNAALERDVQRGREEGLVQRREGTWYCPACELEVNEGFIERHVESQRHRRYKDARRHLAEVAERHSRGELPEWMELRNGVEYCKLCHNFASEAHLESAKHRQRIEYRQRYGALGIPQLALPSPDAIVPHVPTVLALPAGWGDPSFYEWKAERGCLWCRLCWKNADESHVYSERHRARMADPEPFLRNSVLQALTWSSPGLLAALPPASAPSSGPWGSAGPSPALLPPPPPSGAAPPTAGALGPWGPVQSQAAALPAAVPAAAAATAAPGASAAGAAAWPRVANWTRHSSGCTRDFFYCRATGESRFDLPPGEAYEEDI